VGESYGAWAYSLLGNIAICNHCWEEAICNYRKNLGVLQSIQRPLDRAQIQLARACLNNGDKHKAIQFFKKANNVDALAGIEETYMVLEVPEQFMEFCRSSDKWNYDGCQPYMKPANPTSEFLQLGFFDSIETKASNLSWNWTDDFGDCSYAILDPDGFGIYATNGRNLRYLNFSAPRLTQEISGDFAFAVCISPLSDDRPQQGGLLVWKDRDNFLRFERGTDGRHEMRLQGYVGGKHQVAGRGMLVADEDQEAYLRLERIGDEFTSYCSADGKNWLTCGKMTLPMDDPIQVGIHAIGMIDRTIYCGEYREGTATLFRNFRIWKRG
jgi:regulation of enolase protein 1 (concanavalin A-like superfamily)